MGTNYYLAPPPGEERRPTELWGDRGQRAVEALCRNGITLEGPRACALSQEILDALGITVAVVLERVRGQHLGKVNGAGPYCTRCDVSLVTGEDGRNARNPYVVQQTPYYVDCPRCKRTDAVRQVISFTYAMRPEEIAALSEEAIVMNDTHERTMTVKAFRQSILDEAKFEFTDMIDAAFS